MRALLSLFVAIVPLLFGGCAHAGSKAVEPGPVRVFYTEASPSSVVARNGDLWFADGMNINGRTGVGHVHNGRVESIETSSLGLVDLSDLISDASGNLFFFAAGDATGILGEITPNALTVLRRDSEMTTIAYDRV